MPANTKSQQSGTRARSVRRTVLVSFTAAVATASLGAGVVVGQQGSDTSSPPPPDPAQYVRDALRPQFEFWRARLAGKQGLATLDVRNLEPGGTVDGRPLPANSVIVEFSGGTAPVRAYFAVGRVPESPASSEPVPPEFSGGQSPSRVAGPAPIVALDEQGKRIGRFPAPGRQGPTTISGTMTGEEIRRRLTVEVSPPTLRSLKGLQTLGRRPDSPWTRGLSLSMESTERFVYAHVEVDRRTLYRVGRRHVSKKTFDVRYGSTAGRPVAITWRRRATLGAKGQITPAAREIRALSRQEARSLAP